MNVLSVGREFSRTPGSRYPKEGPFSGEEFRTKLLAPRLRDAIAAGSELVVNLDGTAGYGTSFLEESFGGLVRIDRLREPALKKVLRFVSNEEPYLVDDLWAYIHEAEVRFGESP